MISLIIKIGNNSLLFPSQINPLIKVTAAQYKICAETEVIFNSDFWNSVDVVATALVSS